METSVVGVDEGTREGNMWRRDPGARGFREQERGKV